MRSNSVCATGTDFSRAFSLCAVTNGGPSVGADRPKAAAKAAKVAPIGATSSGVTNADAVGFHVSCRLAVSEARLALPNFYNITIRIANVAERLAVVILWLCDKLGSPISP